MRFHRTLTFAVLALFASLSLGAGVAGAPRVYVEADGHFHAGLLVVGVGGADAGDEVGGEDVGSVNLARFHFRADECHRRLYLDLLYEPEEATVDAGIASAAVTYEFRAELFGPDGERVRSIPIHHSGYGHSLGTIQDKGAYRLDLYLVTGVDVDWWLRIRGREPIGGVDCSDAMAFE